MSGTGTIAMGTIEDEAGLLVISYRFRFADGVERVFVVQLDRETLALRPQPRRTWPEWTNLDYYQCANCPLSIAEHPRCPVAANMVDLIETFRDSISFEDVHVRVETKARVYEKQTSLQRGLAALMGIFMVTSGCPIMNRLRPMVDSHLPFATPDESMYRFMTSYLLGQYFIAKNGGTPDWEYRGFLLLLEEIRRVDIGFSRRLQELRIKDASLNALIILNLFGEMAEMAVTGDEMARIERIYMAHLAKANVAQE